MTRLIARSRELCPLALTLLVVVGISACGGDDSATAPAMLGAGDAALASLTIETEEGGGVEDSSDIVVVAYARQANGSPSVGVPVVFTTTSGDFVTGAQAFTDATGRATAVLRNEEDAMVVASAGGLVSPEVYVSARGAIRFIMRFKGDKADAREIETFYVQAIGAGGGAVRGKLEVDFGDGRTSKVADFERRAEITHLYRAAGSYRIKVKIEDERARRGQGSLRIKVGPAIAVTFAVTGDLSAKPGEETAHRLRATRSDGETVTGTVFVDYGDGSSETVENFSYEEIVFHHYPDEGEYTVTANLIADNGRESKATKDILIRDSVVTANGQDDLDLGLVDFLHYSIADWEIDSTVTSVTVSSNLVCIYHTSAGGWPVYDGAEGNPWVFAQIGGQWYGGTFEWLRPGQQCKGVTRDNIGQHVKQVPMISWAPRDGDEVCWAMSTHARFGPESSKQLRSDVYCGEYRYGTISRSR